MAHNSFALNFLCLSLLISELLLNTYREEIIYKANNHFKVWKILVFFFFCCIFFKVKIPLYSYGNKSSFTHTFCTYSDISVAYSKHNHREKCFLPSSLVRKRKKEILSRSHWHLIKFSSPVLYAQ